MKIGITIKNIRKQNKLTQEDFAKLFHVTRQTVSNWENEKSYPDLQTLVDISDKFDISLDKMLKEDRVMVKKINMNIKAGKWMKAGIVILLGILAVLAVSFIILWNYNKSISEDKFQKGIEDCGFSFDKQQGVYINNYDKDTVFQLPNQKMPHWYDFSLSLDFYAKFLDCYIKGEDEDLSIRWSGRDEKGEMILSIEVMGEKKDYVKTFTLNEVKGAIEGNAELFHLLKEGETIYDSVYRLD